MEFLHVVLEPWRGLSCLTCSPSVQLVRLPLAVVCWQHIGDIVLKDCIVCLEEFTSYPCSSIVHRQHRGQKWLLRSPLGPTAPVQLQLPHISACIHFSSVPTQSHCHGVVLSYILRYVKKLTTSYFYINHIVFLKFVGWFSLQMLVEPSRIWWRLFPSVHRLCWPPEAQMLSNQLHKTGQGAAYWEVCIYQYCKMY